MFIQWVIDDRAQRGRVRGPRVGDHRRRDEHGAARSCDVSMRRTAAALGGPPSWCSPPERWPASFPSSSFRMGNQTIRPRCRVCARRAAARRWGRGAPARLRSLRDRRCRNAGATTPTERLVVGGLYRHVRNPDVPRGHSHDCGAGAAARAIRATRLRGAVPRDHDGVCTCTRSRATPAVRRAIRRVPHRRSGLAATATPLAWLATKLRRTSEPYLRRSATVGRQHQHLGPRLLDTCARPQHEHQGAPPTRPATGGKRA